MDSVPKDGTEVLLEVARRAGVPGQCLVGHWMEGGHCIEDHPPIDQGWYFWNGCRFDKASEPLRWAPLPGASQEEVATFSYGYLLDNVNEWPEFCDLIGIDQWDLVNKKIKREDRCTVAIEILRKCGVLL